jgi:hypothetical protein
MWSVPAPNSSLLLGGMIALFIGTFVWLTWLTHARFGTFGFDLGSSTKASGCCPASRIPS